MYLFLLVYSYGIQRRVLAVNPIKRWNEKLTSLKSMILQRMYAQFFKKNHKSANFKETDLKEIFLFKWPVKNPFVIYIWEKE